MFFIIFLTSLSIQTQNKYVIQHTFTYRLTYQSDSTDVYAKQSEDMLLLTNDEVSIFLSENTYLKDSILLDIKNKPAAEIGMLDISRFPKTQFHFKILKEKKEDSITVYDKIYTDNFEYKEQKNGMKWSITTDTLSINGLKCQKATTYYGGRNYEAWFSNEIPISDGPYKFSGLPGLIVKISDLKNHYVFELIAKSDMNLIYSNLKPGKDLFITTKPIYFEKLKDYKKNIIERIAQSGFTIKDDYKEGVKQKLKKRNNPIEL
ncbi:GLPGLI family protein [Formosa agariphila]|nr:GLPGLI family protein [Formosa agariphila]